ncbi:MAG: SIS domain-containing protein [Planctomycetes bacterium]|nr:SIS domain-containing protein [Planctomycetota bacterium]
MPTAPLAAAERFYREAMTRLGPLLDSQRDALDRAAALCTDAIAADGLVHLFGCGHSRMMCEEMTPRQGCFVGWHTIVALGLTYHNLIVGPNGLRQSLHLEKTLGYAEQILRNFAFGARDALIVISTSGIREVIVEMAECAPPRAESHRSPQASALRSGQTGASLRQETHRACRRGTGQRCAHWRHHPAVARIDEQDRPVQHAGRGHGHEHAALRGRPAPGRSRHRAGISPQPPVRRQPQRRGSTRVLLRPVCPARGAAVCSSGVKIIETFGRTQVAWSEDHATTRILYPQGR